jgi:hypothetical protein
MRSQPFGGATAVLRGISGATTVHRGVDLTEGGEDGGKCGCLRVTRLGELTHFA